MNRFLSLILLMAAILLPATSHAQKNMSIQSVFTESYTSLPGATETLLTRSKLHDVNLSLYHALSIPGQPEKAIEIERMVLRDGSKATSKEVRYSSGHLLYGFYVLPKTEGQNRYILFLNGNLNSGGKLVLLYLEGNASVNDVKKLINKAK